MRKFPLLLLLTLLTAQTCVAQVVFKRFALTGLTVFDANHQTPLHTQTILVEDDLIRDVFTDNSKPIPDSFVTISMQGKFAIPGLIDTHVHLATDPSGTDNRNHTLPVLQRMLYSGITTVRDMAGDARTLASLSRDALTGDIVSPDIYYSALMAGPVFFSDPRTGTSTKGATAGKMPYMLAITDSTDLPLAIAAAKGTGASGIKLYANLQPALVKKVVQEATRQNMPVWGHAWLQDSNPSDLVDAGVSPLSHAPLLVHEAYDKVPAAWQATRHSQQFWNDSTPDLSRLFKRMQERHIMLDATLLTYLKWAQSDSTMWYDYELGKRFVAAAYKAGVAICMGTDDDQEAFVQEEIKLLVRDAGLTPADAIIAATLHGAQALHIDNTRGTIAPGKVADLLILDKDPLLLIDNLDAVCLVIKKGAVYKR